MHLVLAREQKQKQELLQNHAQTQAKALGVNSPN